MILVIIYILIVLFSVVIHEVSHGAVAHSLGDNTAKDLGRLTLNPLKHLDFFGSILLPILTYSLGGFVFGYAKPVPYNPVHLKDRTYGPAKVAAAGPLVNIVLALGFGLMLRFLPDALGVTIIPKIFAFIVSLNLSLAIFNLLPFPPLDGHWLLLTFLPNSWVKTKIFIMRYGMFIFIFFLLFLLDLLHPLINFFFRIIVGT